LRSSGSGVIVESSSKSRSRVAWWILSLAVAAALAYAACRGVEWRNVLHTASRASGKFLLASVSVTFGTYFLRGLRWRVVLSAEASLTVGAVFWANMAGYLGNNLLPARAGELIRTVLITRQSRLTKTYVLTTAIAERLMDVIALVLASSLVMLGIAPKPRWMQDLSRLMAIGVAAGAAAVMILPYAGGLVTGPSAGRPFPNGFVRR
jgi:glycosyltransferase 2 family protein